MLFTHDHKGLSEEQPIVILDDPQSSIGRQVEDIFQQLQTGGARRSPIDLLGDDSDSCTTEDGWADTEADYDREIQRIESIDLTLDDNEEEEEEAERIGVVSGEEKKKMGARCAHYQRNTRNPCLCGAYDKVDEYARQSGTLKVRQVHGVTGDVRAGRFLVDFIELGAIWVHRASGAVVLRGLAYTRTRNLDGRVQAYQNEVCQVMQVDTDDPRPDHEQAAVQVTLDQLRPGPRILHKTNKPFPEGRFDPADYRDKADREDKAPLVCRWQHVMHYPDRRYRRAQRPVDGEVLRHFVQQDIAKQRHRGSDLARLDTWRCGQTMRGGSFVPNHDDDVARATEPIAPGQPRMCHRRRRPGQKYTAADMFSGAGGVTTGAKQAGFRVLLAVDSWPRCNATYRANHPDVDLREVDIMDFCNDLTDDYDDGGNEKSAKPPLDLVHLSPPCQTWSPAHTVMGRNDPANMAALSACQHIVYKHRPRLVTLEQTFGMIQERHLPYFNALVQSLTRYGYSLQWRVFPLVQFGLPQNRKRLLMLGAAPGEPLPPWPAPTHRPDDAPPLPPPSPRASRQRRYVSAIQACRGLRPGARLHDVEGAKPLRPRREPWDGHKPMNRTITTSGGQSYHWDGGRELTLAEFARLQGFPYDYQFVGPCIKKQIGNAFPPRVVGVFMAHLRRHLERLDGISDDVDVVRIGDDDNEHGDGEDKDDRMKPSCNNDGSKDESVLTAKINTASRQDMLRPQIGKMSLEYINDDADPHDSWRAAIEESKRGDRRRSTADSSVVITGTKHVIVEVEDNDDDGHDDHDGAISNPSPSFPSHVLSSPHSRQCYVDPFPTAQIPLPHNDPLPHLRHNSSQSFDSQVYARNPATPSSYGGYPFCSTYPPSPSPSTSTSRAALHRQQQRNPTKYGHYYIETFQHNIGAHTSRVSCQTCQGNGPKDKAFNAALHANVPQRRVEGAIAVQIPTPGSRRQEEFLISVIAEAIVWKPFGTWNPPRENGTCVGKGREKSMGQRRIDQGEASMNAGVVPDRSGGKIIDEDRDIDMYEGTQLERAIATSIEVMPQKEVQGQGQGKADTKRSYNGDQGGSPTKKGRICD